LNFGILNPLLKQQVMASDEKFILKGLTGVGDLGAFVFYKILHPGGAANLNTEDSCKHLTGDVGEPRCDFMGIDQKHSGLGL
jgi:hypothetical protein